MQTESTAEIPYSDIPHVTSGSPHLTVREAAAALGVTCHTLFTWRRDGVGPAYLLIGRTVLYPKEFIDRHLEHAALKTWAMPGAVVPLATSAQILSGAQPLPVVLCGIYFLIEDRAIVYVGKSVNILRRVYEHISIKEYGASKKGFDSFSFVTVDAARLDDMEKHYISEFLPKYNTCTFSNRVQKMREKTD